MTTTLSPEMRQALLQALREDQEFREEAQALLLTQQLLQLPEQVARLTDQMAAFTAEQREITAELKQATAEQKQFNAEQRQVNAQVNRRLEWPENAAAELRSDLNQVKGDVSQLVGSDVERKVQSNIANILRRYDNALRQVVTLKGPDHPADLETSDRIADAQAAGAITEDEYAQLDAVDLIVRARTAGATEDSYFAIEISRTISGQDISRAAARADILGRALRVPAQGAVIGYQIQEGERRRADADSVAVITYARLAPVVR